jgi:hypothetical protein
MHRKRDINFIKVNLAFGKPVTKLTRISTYVCHLINDEFCEKIDMDNNTWINDVTFFLF